MDTKDSGELTPTDEGKVQEPGELELEEGDAKLRSEKGGAIGGRPSSAEIKQETSGELTPTEEGKANRPPDKLAALTSQHEKKKSDRQISTEEEDEGQLSPTEKGQEKSSVMDTKDSGELTPTDEGKVPTEWRGSEVEEGDGKLRDEERGAIGGRPSSAEIIQETPSEEGKVQRLPEELGAFTFPHTSKKTAKRSSTEKEDKGKQSPTADKGGEQETSPGVYIHLEGGTFDGAQIGGTSITHIVQHHYHSGPDIRHPPPASTGHTIPALPPALSQLGTSATVPQALSWDPAQRHGPDFAAAVRSLESDNQDTENSPVDVNVDFSNGVITIFKNLLGGPISISKTAYKKIEPSGDLVNVGGCSVTFPPDSVAAKTHAKVKAEIDSTKLPANVIAYAPTLCVSADGLKKKLRVKLPAWCVNDQQNDATACIFHKPDNSDNWQRTCETLPLTDDPFFEFDWGDFSDLAIGNDEARGTRIFGGVYTSAQNDVNVAYHINAKGNGESMAAEWVAKHLSKLKPPRFFRVPLGSIWAKEKETVQTRITCEAPPDVRLLPSGPFMFDADKKFRYDGAKIYSCAIWANFKKQELTNIQCEVLKSGQPIERYGFNHIFLPQRKTQRKLKKHAISPPAATSRSYLVATDTTEEDIRGRRRPRDDDNGRGAAAAQMNLQEQSSDDDDSEDDGELNLT